MPFLVPSPTTRRQFLSPFVAAYFLRAAPEASRSRWALLSDPHVPANPEESFKGFRPWHNLKQTAPEVLKSSPAGVVINGDVARLTGELADYEAVRGLIQPLTNALPVAMSLGNHDDRENFLKIFSEHPGHTQKVKAKHILVLNAPPIRFVILDSLAVVNKVFGILGKPQRTWLDQFLRSSDETPTVVFIHHTLGDEDWDLVETDRLLQMLKPIRKVKAVICGHSHIYSFREMEGIHVVNQPSVGYPLDEGAVIGWLDTTFGKDGADFRFRTIEPADPQNGKITSLRWRA